MNHANQAGGADAPDRSARGLHVLSIALGTYGDVHPFLGVSRALAARGHEVEFVANPLYREQAANNGLGFLPVGDEESFVKLIDDPRMWSPLHGARILGGGLILPYMEPIFELIRNRSRDNTVVLAPVTAFGARIAQEALGVRLITLALQPVIFQSVEDSPSFPAWLDRPLLQPVARLLRRAVYRLITGVLFDPVLRRPVNEFRARFGLPPQELLLRDWIFSRERIIGLFPQWFGMPRSDWPTRVSMTGFPLFDEAGQREIPAAIEQFLSVGEPPVIFTPGTGNRHARKFFEIGIEACRRLGRRCLLLTHFPEQVPSELPESARHFDYAPFSAVFPRAACVVYQGGIGTAGQALAAGTPHVVVPDSFDQPDNAGRLMRLGVGRRIWPQLYTPARLERNLRELIESPRVQESCREFAARIRDQDSLEQTCRLIEQHGAQPRY